MSDKRQILVVEDDIGLQKQIRWGFDDYDVLFAENRAQAIAHLRAHTPAVVTLDLGLPPDPDGVEEGFATLEEILSLRPETKVIVASGHEARESAQRAIAMGAYDFYQKPVDMDELSLIARRAFHLYDIEEENRRLSQKKSPTSSLGNIVTASSEMLKLCRTVERVAPADISVILLGASGTGKELLARALHDNSPRASGHFVALNCAAIPHNLLESELFGFEKGAFTGAARTTPGKIEQAQKGTLFLDEVGDIPLDIQVKLLRFLQERVVERIGGRQTIPVDVRVVCATHRDLNQMIAEETFREDLYYRLAEVVLHIPALAQRPGDPTLLAHYFMTKYKKEFASKAKGFSPDALRALEMHDWPGNVRELENRVKRAIIMSENVYISAADLDLAQHVDALSSSLCLRDVREHADRIAIIAALQQGEGNMSKAAELLQISRPTLYDLVKKYSLAD